MRLRRAFSGAAWLLFWAVACRGAADNSPWGDGPVDRPQDPTIVWGRLDNGLRYAVMPNRTPKGRVSLRLLVAAGSLMENEFQRGIAHFVEHMAFRGSRHFPHSTVLPVLERLGMSFGADTLAFTNYDYTEYRLEMPDASPATLQSGLEVLRDFAGELTFDRSALDIERGVVLSEVDLRRTPEFGMSESNLAYLWPDSRLTRRSPGGERWQIQGFQSADLKRFYDAWYRPERMAVIAVGDAEPRQLVRLIAARFASLRGRGPAPAQPPDLYPSFAAAPDVAVFTEPGWRGAALILEHPERRPIEPSTHAQRLDEIHRQMAMAMFQRTLEIAAERPGAPFSTPTAAFQSKMPGWTCASCTLAVALSDLPFAIRTVEQLHRRTMLYGFSAAELQIVKGDMRVSLRDAVRAAGTRDSRTLAENIESRLLYGGALFTPAQWEEDLEPGVEATTRYDCLHAFRASWTLEAPHVFLLTSPPAPVGPDALARAFNDSRAEKVSPPPPEELPVFDYTYFGPVSSLTADHYVADLDLHLAQYGNGVALNFKSTAFDADQVTLCVRIAGGVSSVPPNSPALPLLTTTGFLHGGLGEFSARQLRDVLSGHDLSIGFFVDHDAFCFYGRCARGELRLALQYIAAFITDPAFRPQELKAVYFSAANAINGERERADAVITSRFLWFLSGEADQQYTPPDWLTVSATGYAQMAGWLLPCLRSGSVEATVVGDVSWAETQRAMAQSLAQLRPRPPPAEGALGASFPPVTKGPLRYQFSTSRQVLQSCLCLLWQIPSITDMMEQRRGYMAAAVLQERIIDRLRMELGRTYSPTIEFGNYDSPFGLAYLEVRMELSPPLVGAAYRIIQSEVAALSSHRPSPDVFKRAREPVIRALADDMRNNSYWAYTVLQRARELPRNVAAPRTRVSGYASITADDVTDFMHRHVGDRNLVVIVTRPP